MRKLIRSIVLGLSALALSAGIVAASSHILSSTDFESFTIGASVDGQGGWSATGSWDEEVADDAGNTVWRVSNAVTAGSFGDMPFAPRPGGIPADTVNDPVNSNPEFFAGESSTLADHREFFAEFDIRSATGAPQPGLRITVSADNGQGARQSFVGIEDTGVGLRVTTFDYNPTTMIFDGPVTIADGLSYTDWHKISVDAKFFDGTGNDVVRYIVNGTLVHTGPSWEEFYRDHQPALHPLGVPVQTLLFRLSGTAAPAVSGNGFYVDNVTIGIGLLGLVPTNKEECKNGGWKNLVDSNGNPFKNQGQCVAFVASKGKSLKD